MAEPLSNLKKLQVIKSSWFSKLTRSVIIAYFVTSIFLFIIADDGLRYFDIQLLTQKTIPLEIGVITALSIFLTIISRKWELRTFSLLLSFFLLLYLVLFSFFAPAYSLMVGVLFVGLPPAFYSFKYLIHNLFKGHIVENILAATSILIMILLIINVIIHTNDFVIDYIGTNRSQISSDSIVHGNRLTFLILGVSVAILIIGVYLFQRSPKQENHNKLHKLIYIIVIGLALYEIFSLSSIMFYRLRTLYTPTYDFGIFSQMFYNMKHLNGPITTLERSHLLSHFQVHMSPVFYLFLPIFAVFPFPETLQILQVLVVAVGLIPLYLIGKHFKLSDLVIGVILVVYIFHPAIIGSSFYDLHENCFLAPMLLFVIYFMITQKRLGIIISTLLTLMIKEDTFFYLILLGFYFMFAYNKQFKKPSQKLNNAIYSSFLIVLSIIYFIVVSSYINQSGEGIMFWRYDNLNGYPDLGILGIVVSLFQNPGYLLATMFSPDKIYSLLLFFLMLGFIPLLSRNLSNYWLVIPLIVLNFATTYPYQHQFGYQYYYGTTVIVIFMMVLSFKERQNEVVTKNEVPYLNLVLSLLTLGLLTASGAVLFDTKSYYINNYSIYEERNTSMRELLLSIPSDKKVIATGYLTTYLSDREVLYDFSYYPILQSDIQFDYVMIDLRISEEKVEQMKNKAIAAGYVVSDLSTEFILVLEPETSVE